jgi:hypothetical protein
MTYSGCWGGVAIVLGGIVAAVVLSLATQWLFRSDELREGHDFTGALLSVVGTLYAVLLGLVVVDAMVRFERAMDGVQMESNCLADIFLLGERLPEPYRSRIHEHCRRYVHQVVELEWPLMAEGRMSADAVASALAIARSLDGFEPTSEAEKIIYPSLLDQIRELWDHRRGRAGACESGIPAVEWVALVMGAGVTMFLGGLFQVGSGRLKMVVTVLAALVIGLNLYLVSLFGYPFSGELTVSKHPFLSDMRLFDRPPPAPQ